MPRSTRSSSEGLGSWGCARESVRNAARIDIGASVAAAGQACRARMHCPAMQPPAAPRWDRRATAALLLLLLLCAASTAWLVHPWYEATRLTADGSIYLLTAKSLLAGEGYAVLGEPFTVRPPGFSLLLAPLLAARGLDFHALNL